MRDYSSLTFGHSMPAKPTESRADVASRKEKKLATRAAIREAALKCFAKKGFVTTSIADITDAAGVAKGTFYVHYEDKEALLDEVLTEFNDVLAARLQQTIFDSGDRPLESIVRTLAGIYLDHWMSHAAFVRAFAERSTSGLDVSALPFGINPPVRDLLIEALRARTGGAHIADPELVVHGLLAMWLRLGLQMIFRPKVDPAHVVDTLVLLTTGALERVLGPQAARGGR